MKYNSTQEQHFSTTTSWHYWPVIEQFFILKRRAALCDINKVVLFVFAFLLVLSSTAIIKYDIKRQADLGGIMILYLATLMLALQPERITNETDESLLKKQARHLRIALGFVAFGAMLQLSSFSLDGMHSTEENNLKVIRDSNIGKSGTKISLIESRLSQIEAKNIILSQNLASERYELERVKGIVETLLKKKTANLGNVSNAVQHN